GRLGYSNRYEENASVILGVRRQVAQDLALGFNVGADFYQSEFASRQQASVSAGIEILTSQFDARFNYRLPLSDTRTIAQQDPTLAGPGPLLIENNRLIERRLGFRLDEIPLRGFNGEVGYRAPIADNFSIRAFAGGFHYDDSDADDDYSGLRGGLELDLDDLDDRGTRFSIGGEIQDDNRFGTQARLTARLTIPLGGSAGRARARSGLHRQMGDRVRRDYAAPSGTRRTGLTADSFAIDPRTGQAFGGIYFVNGAGTTGAGTFASPTTIGDGVARAGQNGVVVALGNAGNINTPGVTLATNQYLLGGASSIQARLTNGQIAAFGFGGSNGIIVGTDAAGAAVTMGQGSVLRDLAVRGSGVGVRGSNVGSNLFERLTIENTGGTGLSLTNVTGALLLDGLTVRNGAGTGVVIDGGNSITIRNSTLGGGTGALDINDNGGTLSVSLSNLALSTTTGTVLDIDGSGAGAITVTGLSGITIAGGPGQAGGFSARSVTFDADSAAAGIQAVSAGRMEVGTLANRVTGDGVNLTDVTGSLTFADLDIANSGGTGLLVANAKINSFTLTTVDGTIDTVGGTAMDLDPLVLNVALASVSSTNAPGAGLVLDEVTGTLQIGTLNISGAGQQGLFITGGSAGQVGILGGLIQNSAGAAVQVGENGVADSGGTINLSFGAAITEAGPGPAVAIFNAGGDFDFTGPVTGSGGIDIRDTLSGSAVDFLTVALTGTADPAILLSGTAGSVAFGNVTIADPLGDGIVLGSVTGGVTFNNVDITGLGAFTGLDLAGTQGAVTFATLDISGTGAGGSIGIDLTGSGNTADVLILNPSTIQGVATGVDLTNASMAGTFQYGDGDAADGLESTISADVPLIIAGLNASQGVYNFADVNLVGDISNLTGTGFTAYWVLEGATGAGTRDDPGSLAGAEASGAQFIVLLNDPTGGGDTLDAIIAGGSLDLGVGQTLLSFLNTDFFAVGGVAMLPPNLIVSGLPESGILNPFAGSGAPTLTTSLAGFATVNLNNDVLIDGVIVANGATGAGIGGIGAANALIRNSRISGASSAIALADGAGNASVTLSNLLLSASGGAVIDLDGTGAGTLTVRGLGNITAGGGNGETGGLRARNVTFDASAAAGNQAVSATIILGTSGARVNGIGIDLQGSTGSLIFNPLSIFNSGGTGLNVVSAPGQFTLSSVGGTIDTANGSALAITGTSLDLVLGTVRSTNAATASVFLSGVSGFGAGGRAVDIASLTVTGGVQQGLFITGASAGTYAFGAGSAITSAGAGVQIGVAGSANSGGAAALSYLGNITQTAGGALVAIAEHGGSATFGTGTLSATSGTGLQFSNADGNYAFNGTTTLNGGNAGIDILAGSAGTFTFAAGTSITSPTGNGFDLRDSSANVTYAGTLTYGAAAAAVNVLNHVTGTLSFTGALLSSSGGTGLVFDNADGTYGFGSFALGGGAAGIDILNGSAGGFVFGDIDIVGVGANQTGVDLRGATGAVTFATLDITGASASGSRGIDLRGSTTAAAIVTSESGTISGVGIGVDLSNAAITGSFRYGDGSNSDADGAASAIDATTPIVIAGLNAASGSYNFADVVLTGDVSALATDVTTFWVREGASGAGTRADPGSLAGAEASGAGAIILLDDLSGGQDVLDAAGAGGSLDLAVGQQLLSFLNGDTITLGGGAPANVILFGIAPGIVTNPFAGSGAPILTTSAGGGAASVILAGGNRLDGLVIANGGTGAGVFGDGAGGLIEIAGSRISGNGGAISITDGAANAVLALRDLTLGSGATTVSLLGTGAGTLRIAAFSNLAIESAGAGAINLNDVTFDADGLGGTVDGGMLTIGAAGTPVTGNGLFGIAAIDGALSFSAVSISSTGRALTLQGGTLDLTLGSLAVDGATTGLRTTGTYGGNITVTGNATFANTSSEAIILIGGTGGTVDLQGTTTVTGSNVRVAGFAGAVLFSDLDIDGQGSVGTGLTVLNTTGPFTLAGGTITAVTGDGINIENASATISNVTVTGGAGGEAIDFDAGASNVTFALSNATLASAGGNVVDIARAAGSGTVTITALAGNTVLGGNGETGGIVIAGADGATEILFDATPGGAVNPVAGGNTTIGILANPVTGAGLSLVNVAGQLDFGILDIATSGGAGLNVNNSQLKTVQPALSLTLTTTGGTINAVAAPALVLDPLNTDLNFSTVTSTNSTGAGIIIDGVTGTGNANNALNINNLNISN
ncbi:MAG: beta strand repeat-containing protein, partial [Sphingomonas sp.]